MEVDRYLKTARFAEQVCVEAAGSRIPVMLPQTCGRRLPQVDAFPVQWMDFARQKERSRR
jgi:hypothetical protein